MADFTTVLDEANRNPLECQKLCAANDQCVTFMYNPEGKCYLTTAGEGVDEYSIPATHYNIKNYTPTVGHWYSGPRSCPADQAQFCDYFIPSQ